MSRTAPFPLAAALSFALVLAACGQNSPAPPAPPTPAPTPGAPGAPTVLSTVPANGASGVAKDTNVVVTFSRPMDKAATQTAFQSPDLGPATFTWNADGTVLTVDPNADLVYNTGATARTYTYTFNSAAKDISGNALADTPHTFKTLRRVTATANSTGPADGYVRSDGRVFTDNLTVGDSVAVPNASFRAFVTFDLNPLLPADVTPDRVEAVSLKLRQQTITGTPYSGLCTTSVVQLFPTCLLVEHVDYGASLAAADYDTAPIGTVGSNRTATANTTIEFDALAAVRDAAANRAARGGRAQFRLRFSRATDGDGKADYVELPSGLNAANKPALTVTYLAP